MKITKLIFASLAMTLAGLGLASCDSETRLAKDIQGTWSGNPQQVVDSGASSATATTLIEFVGGSDLREGTVNITALVSVENVTSFNDSVMTPLEITASGTATITGVYQVKDDDEIIVSLDGSSLNVAVDPDAVQLNMNVLTEESDPVTTQLKAGASVLVEQQVRKIANQIFSGVNKIDDIKIHGSLMEAEINHRDLTFSRSAQ